MCLQRKKRGRPAKKADMIMQVKTEESSKESEDESAKDSADESAAESEGIS